MLNDFIKETDREFQEKFCKKFVGNMCDADLNGFIEVRSDKIKSFTSSKLREFAGEFRKKVEGMKETKIECHCGLMKDDQCLGQCVGGYNNALDSVLNLLNGVGKE